MKDKIALNKKEAAKFLGISINTLSKYMYAGDIPHITMGMSYLIPKKGLEEWLDEQAKQCRRIC